MPKYMIAFFFFLNFGVVLCHPKYMKLSKVKILFSILSFKKKKIQTRLLLKVVPFLIKSKGHFKKIIIFFIFH